MKSSEYWQKRFELLEQAAHQQGAQCYADIEKQYRQAQKTIEGQIASWYQRFADNNGVTLADAKRMLNAKELAELKWDIQDYIRYGKENARNQQWVKQLENASARFHVSRLEALKLQTQQSIEVLFGNQLDSIDSTMRNIYKSGYYHTAYEIQKGVGVGRDFFTLDDKQIGKVINKPWAADGKNFSERIWGNRQKLVNELNQTLTQNIILGKDPQKAIDEIARKMNTSKVNAGRLVMTEEAFFNSAAQKDCFAELDVEMYEIVATIDSHTSDICRGMDGKHFKMSEWQIGVTAPPFHVYCRTTTVPFFDDEFDSVGERAARGADGETYYVPGNMNYKEWESSFVNGNISELQEINMVNTQAYRPIERSQEASDEMRGNKTIAIRKVENSSYNGLIYISNSVNLKRKQFHNMEISLNKSLDLVSIDKNNVPRCIIISPEEMQTAAVCTYKAENNTMYINSIIADEEKIIELQKDMACPQNTISTYVHEFIHWKDAQDYRRRNAFVSQVKYLEDLRSECKKKLDELEKQGYDIFRISEYANEEYHNKKYDETWTEYRVKEILERGN